MKRRKENSGEIQGTGKFTGNSGPEIHRNSGTKFRGHHT